MLYVVTVVYSVSLKTNKIKNVKSDSRDFSQNKKTNSSYSLRIRNFGNTNVLFHRKGEVYTSVYIPNVL